MRTRSQSSVMRTVFVLALAALALAVPAANAHNSTYEVALTYGGGYPGYLNLVDLCGGSGTMRSRRHQWVQLGQRPVPTATGHGTHRRSHLPGPGSGIGAGDLDTHRDDANGVTYTGSGKTSTRDFPTPSR